MGAGAAGGCACGHAISGCMNVAAAACSRCRMKRMQPGPPSKTCVEADTCEGTRAGDALSTGEDTLRAA